MNINKLSEEKEINDLSLIDQRSFSSEWKKEIYLKMMSSDKYQIFGGYVNSKLVCFICILDTTDVLEILRIAVDPDHRRQGYAEQLLEFAAQNSAREELFLEVRHGNNSAINLYKKNGFQVLGIRKNYYKDNNEDAVIMSKKLN